MKAKTIILAGLVTEGILILLWLLGVHVFQLTTGFLWLIDLQLIFLLALSCLPLLLINYLLFFRYQSKKRKEFLESMVIPLCKSLNPAQAFLISLIAGFGEELFFRDFLLPLFSDYLGLIPAILLSSYAFAYLHFIGKLKKYYELVLIYTLVGCYFGALVSLTNNIVLAIATHALYDFLAILSVRKIRHDI